MDLTRDDILDEDQIRAVYDVYLGRPPYKQTVPSLLERGVTRAWLERHMLSTPEYRKKGPLMATTGRGRWDGSILVMEAPKVLFYPIAKVANTSVKDWALRMAGHDPDPREVHRMLDGGKVRLQARYRAVQEFDALIRDPDWARVAILRDPLDRLVSCYWDKFVRTRAVEAVLNHTRPVYRFVLGEDPTEEQIAQGVTFRQFCHYINLAPREEMDPHWAPQSRYLETFRWTHLFDIRNIDAFERFVQDRCPRALCKEPLGLRNVAPRSATTVTELLVDTPPALLDKHSKPPNAVFVTPDIAAFVRDYFALDHLLLEKAGQGAA